ncbi:MAG: Rrf2 family transcriptional regulator [Pygmaiobacter massiliensis]|nr:Rrf2 family transcriptional regulator [Pygmaiobacter massiliensis]
MHITLEADYAVRIVDCLSTQSARLDAGKIAEQTGVTPRFTLKILHKLVSSGIVRSYKGSKGGYELAREAGEITLREVIETVEGTYTFSRCLDPAHICNCKTQVCRRGNCRFQRAYDEISEIVRAKLDETTFAG